MNGFFTRELAKMGVLREYSGSISTAQPLSFDFHAIHYINHKNYRILLKQLSLGQDEVAFFGLYEGMFFFYRFHK